MSLFSDVVDEVLTLTQRPDLTGETNLAVRQATLAAHRSDFYVRDRTEVLITPGSASIFQLDIPTWFPNWRAFSHIRPYSLASASLASFILGRDDFIAPDGIFDEYLIERVNKAYVAGNSLNVRLESAYDSLVVGYYVNPVLTPEGAYESWIAREQRAVITIDAAKRVLEVIGYLEAAAKLGILLFGIGGSYNSPMGGEYQLLKMSAITETGA